MDLTSKKELKILLERYGVRPRKRLGQHFLVERRVLWKIIEAAGLTRNDVVLEIGPGLGVLTKELAKRVKRVVAVEKDKEMVKILQDTLAEWKNVEIVQGDVLKIFNYQPSTRVKLGAGPVPHRPALVHKGGAGAGFPIFNKFSIINYKVVANLPYYIVAPAIRLFLETKNPPKEMVLMAQKEVAQRITARPPQMSVLAVAVQFYAEPKIISYVSKKSFWPQPKVDSAIIKIVSRQFRVAVSRQFSERFFRIVKAGFSHPRKQLLNNLSGGLKRDRARVEELLWQNGIDPTQRAETLTVDDWLKLTKES